MPTKQDEHQRLIVEQFSQQAVPFAEMPIHSNEDAERSSHLVCLPRCHFCWRETPKSQADREGISVAAKLKNAAETGSCGESTSRWWLLARQMLIVDRPKQNRERTSSQVDPRTLPR